MARSIKLNWSGHTVWLHVVDRRGVPVLREARGQIQRDRPALAPLVAEHLFSVTARSRELWMSRGPGFKPEYVKHTAGPEPVVAALLRIAATPHPQRSAG